MKSLSASLFLILLLPLLLASARTGRLFGGWTQISDLNDPHVIEIGKFSVAQFNEQSKAGLEFLTIVSGKTQVVSGINYSLVLKAKKGTSTGNYQAFVWEKSWENIKQLTSFKPVA